VVLPEGLVFDRDERIDKIFRHIFIFDDLAVFRIEDVVDLLALIVKDNRRGLYSRIDVFVVILRSKSYYRKEVDESGRDKYKTDSNDISEQLGKAETVFAVFDLLSVFDIRSAFSGS